MRTALNAEARHEVRGTEAPPVVARSGVKREHARASVRIHSAVPPALNLNGPNGIHIHAKGYISGCRVANLKSIEEELRLANTPAGDVDLAGGILHHTRH